MAMTVKKLIAELEKIENKYLEVECQAIETHYKLYEIDTVRKSGLKVVIYTKDNPNVRY